MKITVAKSAGFCFGVRKAIEAAKSCGSGSVTFGEIIHNNIVVDKLKEDGISPVETVGECAGKRVVVRSHGVGRDVYNELLSVADRVIDATCPFVVRIHDIVKEKHEKGLGIAIIGEVDHPEVIGTNGWCDYSATIISTVKDAEDFVQNCQIDTVVVCQTTFSLDRFKNIEDIIKNCSKIVEIFDTICYTTKDRQHEAQSLAVNCDCMLVVGSRSSSNTMKLFDICKDACRNTFLVNSIADTKSINCNNIQWLGITAGASTPNELIQEVVNTMSESQEKENQMSEFERLLAEEEHVEIKAGKKLEVTVINANAEGIMVGCGGKKDAFIEKSEVEMDEADYNVDNYPAGMTFMAEIIDRTGKTKDLIAMSKKRIELRIKEQLECEEILQGTEFTVKIEKAVKGGLLSKLGPYTIFVPQSQIRMGYESNIEKYVGKEMKLRMIPSKNEETAENKKMGRRIVASHRVLIEEEKSIREEAFWNSMIVDEVVKGKVKRFATFGAFVSVNGNDCLAHIGDLSWTKVVDPSDILEINKTYDFLVLNADRETGKVSLGYKQLQPKPYEEAFDKYPVGTIVKGTVERIFNYGAFVTIDKGIDGLIPVSEISYSYVKDANEAFTQGQEIEAKVIKFEGNKITLSVKALLAPPVRENQEIELTEEEFKLANERRAKANAKRFENTPNGSARKSGGSSRPRRPEDRDEVKSWTTEASGATFADLFKGLNFEVAEDVQPVEVAAVEEQPVEKKVAKKKAVKEVADATEVAATEEKVAKKKAVKEVADATEVAATEEQPAAKKVAKKKVVKEVAEKVEE